MSKSQIPDEMPAEVRAELEKALGRRVEETSEHTEMENENPEPPPPTDTENLITDMKRVIEAIQELGKQMQSTQAAVMRAQVKSTIDDDKLMALAIQVKELQMRSEKK